nr:MAG TPA: hypothetical protein [Caudoviricetes sp.]
MQIVILFIARIGKFLRHFLTSLAGALASQAHSR